MNRHLPSAHQGCGACHDCCTGHQDECQVNPPNQHSCSKPSIQRFDYQARGRLIENRVCLTCKHHWWDGKEYTREEWDRLMECERCHEKVEQLYCGGYCEPCVDAIAPDVMACDLDTD